MDPYSSPYIIPQNSPQYPFPHSLLRTRQSSDFLRSCPAKAQPLACSVVAWKMPPAAWFYRETGVPLAGKPEYPLEVPYNSIRVLKAPEALTL